MKNIKKIIIYGFLSVLSVFSFAGVAMAAFPTSLSNWAAGNTITSAWANALEAKIGVTNSSVITSLDYMVHSLMATTSIPTLSITNSQVSNFSTGVNSYIHASTTIPKTYTANTFSQVNTFTLLPKSPATPTATNDLTTKSYVDAQISSGVATATNVTAGKVLMSTAASDANNPIAVGVNDDNYRSPWAFDSVASWTATTSTTTINIAHTGASIYKIVYYYGMSQVNSGILQLKVNNISTTYQYNQMGNVSGATVNFRNRSTDWFQLSEGATASDSASTTASGEYIISNATSTRTTIAGATGYIRENGWSLLNGWLSGEALGATGITSLQLQSTASTTGKIMVYRSTF